MDKTAALNAFDELPCAVVTVDDDGVIQTVNTSLCEWLGAPAGQWLGQPVAALLPKAGALLCHTYVFPLLKLGRQVDEVSLELRHCQGERVGVLLSANRTVHDEVGRVHLVFARVHQRRHMEDQLLMAKKVADQSPSMLFHLRLNAAGEHEFTYVTDAVKPLFGVFATQALQSAQQVWGCVHPEDWPLLQLAMAESASALLPWRCEFRVRMDGQEFWREVHAVPTREPDQLVSWNGSMADITQRKLVESSLRDKASAEQSNRAKSEFLSRMSHELRTPLNGILGFSQLLQMSGNDNLRADQRTRIGYIETAGKTLLRLINEVLEISRIEAGHTQLDMGDVDLDAVIEGCFNLATPMADVRGVRLSMEGPTGLRAHADADRLGQVLLNLISNAIKYGPSGGCVRVCVHMADSQTVDLSVVDEGPGLSAQQQVQLFQPFNRLGAERTGTEGAGLGLVITRGLVQLMGGQLLVDSPPGQGACFTVRLHQSDARCERGSAGAAPDGTQPGHATVSDQSEQLVRRILYVEDNRVNAILMEAVFEDEPGLALQVVGSGEAAIEAVRQALPDVLLLDMQLPDMTGQALLALLRQEPGLAATPAIAVSASAMSEDIALAKAAGFDDYWTKPLNVTLVAPALRALTAQRAVTSGTMQV